MLKAVFRSEYPSISLNILGFCISHEGNSALVPFQIIDDVLMLSAELDDEKFRIINLVPLHELIHIFARKATDKQIMKIISIMLSE